MNLISEHYKHNMTMIPKKIILSFLLLYLANSIVAQTDKGLDKHLSIIPKPVSVKETTGNFIIGKKTKIYVDGNNNSLKKIGEMLSAQLKLETGFDISVNEKSGNSTRNAIILTQNDAAGQRFCGRYDPTCRCRKQQPGHCIPAAARQLPQN